jgi:flotillin
MSVLAYVGLGALGLVVVAVLAVVSRIKVGGPNEAFIITGRRGRDVTNPKTGLVSTDMSGQKVVMGASVFVIPFVQRLHRMDLSSRRLQVAIRGAVSATGIKCDLEGVAIVKVAGSDDMIRAAAQRFLDQQAGIEVFTQEVLAGSLRAIVGRLTVEEIIKDRAAFASAVAEEAETSLTNQGLQLDTFQLQDIQAEGDYLADLGRPEAARMAKEASIAEARARQLAEQERLIAEEAIAVANRTLALKTAEIQAQTDAACAQADAAGPLAQAARDQEILLEQEKVAERQAALKERELDTEIRRPADAARYQVEQEAEAAKNAAIATAEAQRQATIAAAQAAAEQQRLSGEGERSRRSAVAEAVRLEGGAEADAILARGKADAEALEEKARAFEHFGDAAVLDLLTKVLPSVVREASAPLAAVDKLTVISTDGAGSLGRTVASNVEQGLQLSHDLTGVDLRAVLDRLVHNPVDVTIPAVDGMIPAQEAVAAQR